ncbi:D-alanyl-D-alanine carboxypeptidase-like protein [Leucobacter luti]|uniref:D-alanyl-D-alanine carboxypeptidase-like protein n=1 Tax=Leucobacter luti TaxID=340320 RepID=A0A4R6RSC2_9MICO|nr:M15 family metallopeptidase [Leucobacter luti]TDP89155.1 D-alanyl-D-alanine carboxypeptidase-like protein [Leucobacter luti]
MRYESRGLRFRKALVPVLIIAGAASLLALIAGVAVAQLAAPAIAGAAREGEAGTQVAGQQGGGSESVDARGAGAGPTGSGDVDGLLPDGTTPFDDAQPGVTGLAPELLSALREAARAAEAEGITMTVTSGWRSPAYQQQLRVDAIAEYGSEAEAARWVASPEKSVHVSGEAVDVGPWDAAQWVADNGAQFGLCQVYDNEPWHFELRPNAATTGCPELYWDPSYDPRLQ